MVILSILQAVSSIRGPYRVGGCREPFGSVTPEPRPLMDLPHSPVVEKGSFPMTSTQSLPPTSSNPLIKNNQASTIAAISDYVDWLCIQKANDNDTHPGEFLQLETVRVALKTLVDV